MPPKCSPYRLPQYCWPMSHCGPSTAKLALSLGLSRILLRIWTPLLAEAPVSRTWNDSSKSRYFFLLHRKVLNFSPLGVAPIIAPSFTDQYSVRPSQPVVSLPLKNSLLESPPCVAPAQSRPRANRNTETRISIHMVILQECKARGPFTYNGAPSRLRQVVPRDVAPAPARLDEKPTSLLRWRARLPHSDDPPIPPRAAAPGHRPEPVRR